MGSVIYAYMLIIIELRCIIIMTKERMKLTQLSS